MQICETFVFPEVGRSLRLENEAFPREILNGKASKRTKCMSTEPMNETSSEIFGKYVFSQSVMQKMLPKEIYENLVNAAENRSSLQQEYADTIAVAMKEWAVKLGATHYCHWFQPLTGITAEKHDTFLECTSDRVIERFSGEQLLQGEPDASSFPSGGLRSTYEARGYTGWDPSSPAFVWKAGGGVILCIPSVFFSWTGHVLDLKIPLLRSDKKLNDSVMTLLKCCGIEANQVFSCIGLELEYFVIDRFLRDQRPDLLLLGKTVFGAPAPKGQELQDHYLGSIKENVLSFMTDFEMEALKLGIPVKTRHNEVAPSQYEVAPIYERSSLAVDHNILLMELMRKTALKHQLACLLHEKPFHEINGSGKHCNWSIISDTGMNLLNPTGTPENNICFLILLTALIYGIHTHAALLRASVGSASNDWRLGGHEAPPAIISIYLGEELENVLNDIEEKGAYQRKGGKGKYNLGIPIIPQLSMHNTDRNRTSPLAFTGNKFEFRAVGSSQNVSFPATVMNIIVSDGLNKILEEAKLTKIDSKSPLSQAQLIETIIPILQKYLKISKGVRFSGDNYSSSWVQEAKKRKLPNYTKCVESFAVLKSPETVRIFEGILDENELKSRYEIVLQQYAENVNIEMKLMMEIFQTQILPAALKYQNQIASSIHAYKEVSSKKEAIGRQNALLQTVVEAIENAIRISEMVKDTWNQSSTIADLPEKASAFANKVLPESANFRKAVDHLETLVDDKLWPLPKYRELLFLG